MGVIGYVTTTTPDISYPAPTLEFVDEIAAITEEAARLKSDGVDIILALGHSGYDVDQEIARQVADVDVVVGGHSHSFLYTGEPPSVEVPEGEYPTYVTQVRGEEEEEEEEEEKRKCIHTRRFAQFFFTLFAPKLLQDSGKVVPVVQAYCYTKYMGHLELNFDDSGELLTPVDGAGQKFIQYYGGLQKRQYIHVVYGKTIYFFFDGLVSQLRQV